MVKTQKIYIRYQPDLSLTLDDRGSVEIIYELDTDQYWGMLSMAFVLFGGDPKNIEFYEMHNGNLLQMRLGYLQYAKGPLIVYSRSYDPHRERDDWNRYLEGFDHPSRYNHEDFANYTAHLIGQGEAIVKFSRLEFLQGAIKLLQLFDYDPHNYIFELYYQGVEMLYNVPD
jgi:hypothetical protein